ncbi:MAG: response regulator transcription factor [Anaerolineales bacterium]|jgi:YesN/AraC family two-component response regulator
MNTPTKIMVVEDNGRARSALIACISLQAGMRITAEASNGREAIEKIKSSHPDVVILDMQMPVMDGLEATRIIKKRWPNVKVIALTMYQNYQPEALSAGADAFLVKGCSVGELISTVTFVSQANITDKPFT